MGNIIIKTVPGEKTMGHVFQHPENSGDTYTCHKEDTDIIR